MNSHTFMLQIIRERAEKQANGDIEKAIELLKKAAKDVTSCQKKCDLATVIMNLEEILYAPVAQ